MVRGKKQKGQQTTTLTNAQQQHTNKHQTRQYLPAARVDALGRALEPQHAQDRRVRALALHEQRHAPDVADVVHRQHVLVADLAKERLFFVAFVLLFVLCVVWSGARLVVGC